MTAQQKFLFQGRPGLFLKEAVLYSLPLLVLVNVLFFGPLAPRMVLYSIVLLVPFLIIISLRDRFSLDDEKKLLVRPFQSVPFDRVKAVEIYERRDSLRIVVKLGALKKIVLVNSLAKDQKPLLLEMLSGRFPDEIVHIKKSSLGKIMLMLYVLLITLLLGFQVYIQKTSPGISSIPAEKEFLKQDTPSSGMKRLTIEGYDFSLPREFDERFMSRQFLRVEGPSQRIIISTNRDAAMSRERKFFFSEVLGLRTTYDWLRMGFHARYGVLPLMMKSMLMREVQDPTLIEVVHPQLRGFILQGKQDDRPVAGISLSDRTHHREIYFSIVAVDEIPEGLLTTIVSSVRPSEEDRQEGQ